MNDFPVYLIFGLRYRERRFDADLTKEQAVQEALHSSEEAYEMLKGLEPNKAHASLEVYQSRVAEQARWDWTLDQQPGHQETFKVAVERDRDAEMRAEFESHPGFIRWLS